MFMRTTIEIPDALYRGLKAKAARQGLSVKEIILKGVEKEMGDAVTKRGRVRLPLQRHVVVPECKLAFADGVQPAQDFCTVIR